MHDSNDWRGKPNDTPRDHWTFKEEIMRCDCSPPKSTMGRSFLRNLLIALEHPEMFHFERNLDIGTSSITPLECWCQTYSGWPPSPSVPNSSTHCPHQAVQSPLAISAFKILLCSISGVVNREKHNLFWLLAQHEALHNMSP